MFRLRTGAVDIGFYLPKNGRFHPGKFSRYATTSFLQNLTLAVKLRRKASQTSHMHFSEVLWFRIVSRFLPKKPNCMRTSSFAFALGETCAKTNSALCLYRTSPLEVKGNLGSNRWEMLFKGAVLRSTRTRTQEISVLDRKTTFHRVLIL